MRLYLDDDSAWPLLAKLLRKATHEVEMPSDIGMAGAPDPVHLTRAIAENRVWLTKNHDDLLQKRWNIPGRVHTLTLSCFQLSRWRGHFQFSA